MTCSPSSPLWRQCASVGGSHTDPCAPGAGTYTCRERARRRSRTLQLHHTNAFCLQHVHSKTFSRMKLCTHKPTQATYTNDITTCLPRQRYGTTMCVWLRHCFQPFLHQFWMLMGWFASTTLVICNSGYT